MALSKTATAAQKAVEKSQIKSAVERTPEERLADIRRNLASKLAVTPGDTRFLLALYDATELRIRNLLSSGILVDVLQVVDQLKNGPTGEPVLGPFGPGECGSITEPIEDQSRFQL